jgi:hypothetical protein
MVDELVNPAQATADLEPILPEIIRALEHGLQEARAYFDSTSVRFDAAAFAVLVRLHAREYLRKKSLDASDIEVEQVSLCGLWLKLGKYQIKIWKIGASDLRKGLQSEAYEAAQTELFQDDAPLRGFGLAIFWMADELRHLGEVFLVHQLRDDPRCFEWIWSKAVPHPVERVVVAAEAAGDLVLEAAVPEQDEKTE